MRRDHSIERYSAADLADHEFSNWPKDRTPGDPLFTCATTAGIELRRELNAQLPLFLNREIESDRLATPPSENFEQLVRIKATSAPLPRWQGGRGINSASELGVILKDLGKVSPSTAVILAHHYGMTQIFQIRLHTESANPDLEAVVQKIGEGAIVACPNNEPKGGGQLSPEAQVIKVERGWEVSGVKCFATGASGADYFVTSASIYDSGERRRVSLIIPAKQAPTLGESAQAQIVYSTPSETVGLRSAGNGTLEFQNAFVPEGLGRIGARWGEWTVGNSASNARIVAYILAPYVGIAEQAIDILRAHAVSGGTIDTNEFGRLTSRYFGLSSALHSTLDHLDRITTLANSENVTPEDWERAFVLAQQAKLLISDGVEGIVADCARMIGGATYIEGHPLERMQRDARALSHMLLPTTRAAARIASYLLE